MSSKQVTTNEVSADAQAFNHQRATEADDVLDEEPELRPTVEQEIQAKVDANHPDGIVQDYSHLPLAQEERIRAREAELEHISAQAELGTQDGRAERTREVVVEQRREQRESHREPDPRDGLSQKKLARVNQEARRIAERVDGGPGRAAVARALAARVRTGQPLTEAVFSTLDEQLASPGVILPIAEVPGVQTNEVCVEGEVIQLWEPSTHSIQQVGLIADETGKIKFTIWRKSRQTMVREGHRVRFRAAKKNWYQGRCSIALTYHSRIEFPEREPWWKG
jgi:ssDNA-binding replication factor A large subunit